MRKCFCQFKKYISRFRTTLSNHRSYLQSKIRNGSNRSKDKECLGQGHTGRQILHDSVIHPIHRTLISKVSTKKTKLETWIQRLSHTILVRNNLHNRIRDLSFLWEYNFLQTRLLKQVSQKNKMLLKKHGNSTDIECTVVQYMN